MREIDQSGLTLTRREKRLYSSLFRKLDTGNLGVITADIGRPFLLTSGLRETVLERVWAIADVEDCGFLTPRAFCVALRIIGHVQAGAEPSKRLIDQPGPLPDFHGYTDDGDVALVERSGIPDEPPPPYPGDELQVPSLRSRDINQYTQLFFGCKDRSGFVQGNKVREIFTCSQLSNDKLLRVWNLVDRQDRGALDMVEFIVATHLVVSCSKGFLRDIPATLPPSLFETAARRPSRSVSANSRSAPLQASGPINSRLQGPLPSLRVSPSQRPLSMGSISSSEALRTGPFGRRNRHRSHPQS